MHKEKPNCIESFFLKKKAFSIASVGTAAFYGAHFITFGFREIQPGYKLHIALVLGGFGAFCISNVLSRLILHVSQRQVLQDIFLADVTGDMFIRAFFNFHLTFMLLVICSIFISTLAIAISLLLTIGTVWPFLILDGWLFVLVALCFHWLAYWCLIASGMFLCIPIGVVALSIFSNMVVNPSNIYIILCIAIMIFLIIGTQVMCAARNRYAARIARTVQS